MVFHLRIKIDNCLAHYKFSFFVLLNKVTKIPKCYVIVYLLFYISKFSSCLQNARTEHMEMEIVQPIFGILVALTKKRTYQNDMKLT